MKPTAFVFCKTLGHAWDDNPFTQRKSGFGNVLALRCIRCGTERVDTISFHKGDLLARRYHYPEGYRTAEKMTRAELRLELVRQARARQRFAKELEHA